MLFRVFLGLISILSCTCVMPVDLSPKVDLKIALPQTPCSQEYVEHHDKQITIFPITVYINKNMSDDNISIVLFAITKWNERMGTTVFITKVSDRVVDRYLCGSIFINDFQVPDFSEEYKKKTFTWANNCSAEIRIEKKSDINNVLHGLGHALNLRHDLNEASIMFEIPGIRITDMSKCLVGLAMKEFLIKKDIENGQDISKNMYN